MRKAGKKIGNIKLMGRKKKKEKRKKTKKRKKMGKTAERERERVKNGKQPMIICDVGLLMDQHGMDCEIEKRQRLECFDEEKSF